MGASPFGVEDMVGNMLEWVADWYEEDYYTTCPALDPPGPDTGIIRAQRGGMCTDDYNTNTGRRLLPWFRENAPVTQWSGKLGARCCRDLP